MANLNKKMANLQEEINLNETPSVSYDLAIAFKTDQPLQNKTESYLTEKLYTRVCTEIAMALRLALDNISISDNNNPS